MAPGLVGNEAMEEFANFALIPLFGDFGPTSVSNQNSVDLVLQVTGSSKKP